MSNNQNSLQVLTIPAPRYNFGDLVEWQINFNGRLYIYRGRITHRLWCEDEPDTNGYWEYGTKILFSHCQNVRFNLTDYDTVTEDELELYVPTN